MIDNHISIVREMKSFNNGTGAYGWDVRLMPRFKKNEKFFVNTKKKNEIYQRLFFTLS